MGNTIRLISLSVGRGLLMFWNWFWNLVLENKAATWFALSVLGFFFSSSPWTYLCLISAFCAVLVLSNNVEKFINFTYKQASIMLSGLVKTMTGGYGAPFALALDGGIAFILGFAIGGDNGTTIAAIGILSILLAGGLAINKTVSK